MLHARIFSDSVSFIDISAFRVENMRVTVTRGWDYQPCDVVVMYGLANPPRRSRQGRLRNAIHSQHKGPIVVIESSLIGRSFKPRLPRWLAALRKRPLRPRQMHPYFRVGVGGALGDDADFGAVDSPPDRWERVQAELGVTLKPYRREGTHILLIGQIPKDASLRGVDIVAWLQDTAKAIRKISDRPIVVRLHPSMRWRDQAPVIDGCAGMPGVTISPTGRPLSEDLADAWTCVTLSSGAAIDALIAGIPPICLSSASLAYNICSNRLKEVEQPKEPEREQFLYDICYSQWSSEELADGTAWRHILPAVERALAQKSPRPAAAWAQEATGPTEAEPDRVASKPPARRPRRLAEVWTAASRFLSYKPKTLADRGAALLKLERYDEAEGIFTRLCHKYPSREDGFRGLERVATKRRDWPLALKMYDELWARFDDLLALRSKVTLLIRLQRTAEARQFVDTLKSSNVPPLGCLLAAMPLLEEGHDWPAIGKLVEEHEPLALESWELLHAGVNALCRLGRANDALGLIDRSRAGTPSARANLHITTLIQARRYDEADDRFRSVWESGNVGEIRVELLSSLMNAAWKAGGPDLGCAVLARIDAQAPRNKVGELLRFSTPFLRARLMGVNGLDSSPSRLEEPDSRTEERIRQMLAERPALRQAQPDFGPIREICELFGRLRSSHPAFFPDPSFVPRDALEIALRVVDAVDERRPLSLIRLGDGEGSLLPYRDDLVSFRQADREATQRTWWGEDVATPADIDSIEEQLQEAIRSADIVGLPDLDRACRTMLNHPIKAIRDSGRNARGLLASIDFAAETCARNASGQTYVLTSCHIHQALSFWGLWDVLIPRIGSFSLITCHSDLADVLTARHGIEIEHVHLIPPERKYATAFTATLDDRHYPHAFLKLRNRLADIRPGQVFLVAAGVLGKIYCMWIKQAGGVAIDVGSAADFWCGYETRSVADLATYRGPEGMAQRLRQLLAEDPRYSRLLRAQVPSGKSGSGCRA